MTEQDFDFTLVLNGIDDVTDEVADQIYVCGCDDALIWTQGDDIALDFTRRSSSLERAIESAIEDLNSNTLGITVSRVKVK